MAVSSESGLITPIIFNASTLGLKEISSRAKALALKARERKLLPEEYQVKMNFYLNFLLGRHYHSL